MQTLEIVQPNEKTLLETIQQDRKEPKDQNLIETLLQYLIYPSLPFRCLRLEFDVHPQACSLVRLLAAFLALLVH